MTRRAKPLDDADLLARIAERVEGLGDEALIQARSEAERWLLAVDAEVSRRHEAAKAEADAAQERLLFWRRELGCDRSNGYDIDGPVDPLTLDAEGGVFDFGQEDDDGDGASTREAAAQNAIPPEAAQSTHAASGVADPDPDMATFIKGVQRHMCGERASAREEAEPDQGSETVARTASENLASPAKPDLTIPNHLLRGHPDCVVAS